MSDVVVTLTHCSRTHQLHEEVVEFDHLLHVGITDTPCDRLEDVGILIPMVSHDNDIVQLLNDFRFYNIYKFEYVISLF